MFSADISGCSLNEKVDIVDILDDLPQELKESTRSILNLFEKDVPVSIFFSFFFKILLNIPGSSNETLKSTIASPLILPVIFKLIPRSSESTQIEVFNRLIFLCKSFRNAEICYKVGAVFLIFKILPSFTQPVFKTALNFLIILLRHNSSPKDARLLLATLNRFYYQKQGTHFSMLLNGITSIICRKEPKTAFDWNGTSDGGILMPEIVLNGSYTLSTWISIELPSSRNKVEYQIISLKNLDGNGIVVSFIITAQEKIFLNISSYRGKNSNTQTFNFNFLPQHWYNVTLTYSPKKVFSRRGGFILWVDGKKIETKSSIMHIEKIKVFNRCHWGYISSFSPTNATKRSVFRGQMAMMLMLNEALNDEKIQILHNVSPVNPRSLLDTFTSETVFLYHPQATCNNLVIDIFGKSHGLIFGSVTPVKCMSMGDAFCCTGGIQVLYPFLLNLEKFSFDFDKKKTLKSAYSSLDDPSSSQILDSFSEKKGPLLSIDCKNILTGIHTSGTKDIDDMQHCKSANLSDKIEPVIPIKRGFSETGTSSTSTIQEISDNYDTENHDISKNNTEGDLLLNSSNSVHVKQNTNNEVKRNFLSYYTLKNRQYLKKIYLKKIPRYKGDSLLSSIVTCIAYFIHTSELSRKSLDNIFFIDVMSLILECVSPQVLDSKFLNAIDILITALSSLQEELVGASYLYLLWNPRIWTRAPYFVQCQHQLVVKMHINVHRKYIRQVITVPVLLNDFNIFYSYSNVVEDISDVESIHSEPYESNMEDFDNMRHHKYSSEFCFTKHDSKNKLNTEEIKTLRQGIIGFIEDIVLDCFHVNEMESLILSITCANNHHDTLELGNLLLKFLRNDKRVENYRVICSCGGYKIFFVLFEHPEESVRVLGIRIFVEILSLVYEKERPKLINEVIFALNALLGKYLITTQIFTALLGILFGSSNLTETPWIELDETFSAISPNFTFKNPFILSCILDLIIKDIDLNKNANDYWSLMYRILNFIYKMLRKVADFNFLHLLKNSNTRSNNDWLLNLELSEFLKKLFLIEIEADKEVKKYYNLAREMKIPNPQEPIFLFAYRVTFKIIRLITTEIFIIKKDGWEVIYPLGKVFYYFESDKSTREKKSTTVMTFDYLKFLRELLYSIFHNFTKVIDQIHKNHVSPQKYPYFWENLAMSSFLVEEFIFNEEIIDEHLHEKEITPSNHNDVKNIYYLLKRMHRSTKKFYDREIDQIFNIVDFKCQNNQSSFTVGKWKDFKLFVEFLHVFNSIIANPSELGADEKNYLSSSWSESNEDGIYIMNIVQKCDRASFFHKKFKILVKVLHMVLIALFDILHIKDIQKTILEEKKAIETIALIENSSIVKNLNLNSIFQSISETRIKKISSEKEEISRFFVGILLLIEKLCYYMLRKNSKQSFPIGGGFVKGYFAIFTARGDKITSANSILYTIAKLFELLIIFEPINSEEFNILKLASITKRMFLQWIDNGVLNKALPEQIDEISNLRLKWSNILNSDSVDGKFFELVREFLIESILWRPKILSSAEIVEKNVIKLIRSLSKNKGSRDFYLIIKNKRNISKKEEEFEFNIKTLYQKNYSEFSALRTSFKNKISFEKNTRSKLLAKVWRQLNTSASIWRGILIDVPLTKSGKPFYKMDKISQNCGIHRILKINYGGTEHSEISHRDVGEDTSDARQVHVSQNFFKKSVPSSKRMMNVVLGAFNNSFRTLNRISNRSKKASLVAPLVESSIFGISCIFSTPCEFIIPEITISGIFYISHSYIFFIYDDHGYVSSHFESKNTEKRTSEEEGISVASNSYYTLMRQMFKNKFYNRQWPIRGIVSIYSRRYLLRYTALEIVMDSRRGYLFNFPNKVNEKVYRILEKLVDTRILDKFYGSANKLFEARSGVTEQWRRHEISNFEYLMHLNRVASRSFNDLTQYPVFPWILSDYESEEIDLNDPSVYRDLRLPIGALEQSRLQKFKERYESFFDESIPRFHYGSHYSSASAVLFYMIRLEPFTSQFLCLQGGNFDYADRLFSDVSETWKNCLKSTTDVKELIPEFFYLPEMFCNSNDLDLGIRSSTGKPVGDVSLPLWAQGSAERFVRVNREALENDYVSENLHNWIDLIFGYKQRGPAAVESCNTFFHLTYEENVDLLNEKDEEKRQAMLSQIENFGQTPPQLLNYPHPAREPRRGRDDRKIIITRENAFSMVEDRLAESSPVSLNVDHTERDSPKNHMEKGGLDSLAASNCDVFKNCSDESDNDAAISVASRWRVDDRGEPEQAFDPSCDSLPRISTNEAQCEWEGVETNANNQNIGTELKDPDFDGKDDRNDNRNDMENLDQCDENVDQKVNDGGDDDFEVDCRQKASSLDDKSPSYLNDVSVDGFLDDFQLIVSSKEEDISPGDKKAEEIPYKVVVNRTNLPQIATINLKMREYLIGHKFRMSGFHRCFVFPIKDHLMGIGLRGESFAYRMCISLHSEVPDNHFPLGLELKSTFSIKTCPIIFDSDDTSHLQQYGLDFWRSYAFYSEMVKSTFNWSRYDDYYRASPYWVIKTPNAIYVLFSATWDGYLQVFHVMNFGNSSLVGQWKAHRGLITCMCNDQNWLVTGANDFTAILWKLEFGQQYDPRVSGKFFYLITGHDAPLTDVCISKNWNTLVTASLDGLVAVHYIDLKRQYTRTLIGNPGPVTLVKILLDGSILTFCLRDNRLSRYSINGQLCCAKNFKEPIIYAFPVQGNEKVLIATTSHIIYVLNAFDLDILGAYDVPEGIFHITFSQDWMFMFVSTLDNNLICFATKGLNALFSSECEFVYSNKSQ